MEITRDSLLTVAGIAFVTAIALQLWIKPWLTKLYGDRPWHDIALNLSATVLAFVLAYAGLFIANQFDAGQTVAFATIQGIVAAFAAVYGYEAVKNVMAFVGSRGE